MEITVHLARRVPYVRSYVSEYHDLLFQLVIPDTDFRPDV